MQGFQNIVDEIKCGYYILPVFMAGDLANEFRGDSFDPDIHRLTLEDAKRCSDYGSRAFNPGGYPTFESIFDPTGFRCIALADIAADTLPGDWLTLPPFICTDTTL